MKLPGPLRREKPWWKRIDARFAWPAALAGGAAAWYGSESLRHRREGAFGYELVGGVEVHSEDFQRASEALTGAPITDGNDAELFVNGDQIFPAMLETIRGAERTLCLETYVYWRGDIAAEIAGAVAERARAGVDCKVLLDALGSAQMEPRLIREMREAGADVCRFRPPKPYALRKLTNRTHRRVLVADGKVGMTGGVGIAEEWTGDGGDPEHWRDSHVRVRGPVVRGFQGAFSEHWLEGTGEVLGGDAFLPDLKPIADGGRMQFVRSNAGVGDTNAEALYYLAIASARESLDLTAAYFVPRPAFLDALCECAERGVDLRILVPGPHIDKGFVRVAGRRAYESLIEAGAKVFEYQPTMLHAKTMTVDGAWSCVGTINFDNRSFQLHDEVTLSIFSEHFAGLLTKRFEQDIEDSIEMSRERWAGRPRHQRVTEAATTLIRREL